MNPRYTQTELVGPCVVLRPASRGDFSAWSALRQESRSHLVPVEPSWPDDAHTRADWRRRMRAWRSAWRQGRGFAFLIFGREGGTLMGGIALFGIRGGGISTGTLGYWLGERYQGQGVMSEAVTLICKFGFERLGLARIEAGTLLENNRSQHVLERCGFQREGIGRSYLEIAGARRDHVLYARLVGDEIENGSTE